jgi:hypothetical protein
MENNFLCPKCRSVLNIENNIIFSVKTQDNQRGLILLSTKVGDYTVKNQDNIIIEKGDKIQFFCPICRESLSATDVNENLAKVIMQDEDENEYQILFSIVAGEYCTYMVSDDNFKSFGDDSPMYINDIQG